MREFGGLIGRTARKECNGFPDHLSRICALLVLAGGKAALGCWHLIPYPEGANCFIGCFALSGLVSSSPVKAANS